MAIGNKTVTSATIAGTNPETFTHTPVGGDPKGVLVYVLADTDATTVPVTAVTYGGASMTEVTGSPADKVGFESMSVSAWFLGSSVPTGAQTVSVSGSVFFKGIVCISVTGAYDMLVQDTDATINSSSIANPTATLSLGGNDCFCSLGFGTGWADVSISPLTGWTSEFEVDIGSQSGGVYTYDTIDSTDVAMGWTQFADDAVAIGVAIKEDAPAASVDDVNTNEIVTDGQAGVIATYTGFSGAITGVTIINGTYSLACTNVVDSAGTVSFDIPDISALSGLNTVVPFGAVTFRLTDGTDTADLVGTLSPKSGYAVTNGVSIVTTAGSLAENFDLDADIPDNPADGTQFYFPEGSGDGQLATVAADGTFTTNSTTNVPVQVGWNDSGTWKIKNFVVIPSDTTPNTFSFTDQTNVALSTVTESNTITVTGIDASTIISVDVGEYRINAGSWTSSSGTVDVDDTVQLRHTSSASYETAVDQTLTIGGVTDVFTTTTIVEPGVATLSGDSKLSISIGISL